MPEEQAFSVLVKIMFDYGLRDLFKQNFEDLHCKFFQLEKLMQVWVCVHGCACVSSAFPFHPPLPQQEYLPDLFNHFVNVGLEAHMYASQWFLTLFTAKFPLYMVFHIIDLLLCEVSDVHVLMHAHTGTGGDLCFHFQGISVIFNVALALLKVQKHTCTLTCASSL